MARELRGIAPLAILACAPLSIAAGIFEAPSIAVLRIDAAAPRPWISDSPNERQRTVFLTLAVERVLRGPLHPGDRVQLDAPQVETTGRIEAPTTPWSGKTLDPGREYLVFSRGASEALFVADVSETIGVELALDLDRNHWPLNELSRRAAGREGALGVLFAQYLNTRLPTAVLQGASQWNSIADFLESPSLAPRCRGLAATGFMDAVLMSPPAPVAIVRRTAVMAFRLLGLPEQPGFHERLIESYLPNLLGMEGSEQKRSASEIFSGYAGDRQRAAQALAALPASARRNALAGWIAR